MVQKQSFKDDFARISMKRADTSTMGAEDYVEINIWAGNNNIGWVDVKVKLSIKNFADLITQHDFPHGEIEVEFSDEERTLMA